MNQLIDRICDDFEAAWHQGQPLRIETLLQQSGVESRDELLDELLRLEISLRQTAGQRPGVKDYAERFPDHLHLIESALATSAAAAETAAAAKAEEGFTTQVGNVATGSRPSSASRCATSRKAVGRYTIVDTLGQGGQAEVHRAVHPTLPIEVAIKLTHTCLSGSAREALLEEARILCDLDHPNIARIRDFDFDNGRPFMVLDFIRGRSLGQIAHSQPPLPGNAAELVAKVARAIGYANARGVIHRDLKPDNVVIDENGQPKIIDFGMSRMRSGIAGNADEANEVSGTLAYMAPEQAAGIVSETDHRVDVFALGAILYRLLVGKAPYPNRELMQLLRDVRQGDYDRTSLDAVNVPEPLKAICRSAMETDQAKRFATAELMAEALERVIAPPQSLRSVRSPEKSPLSAIAIGLAATVSLLLAGLLLSRSPSSAPAVGDTVSESTSNALIKGFELIHIGNSADRAEFSGSLLEVRQPRENDDIQVRAEFTEPVYCYLVAFNPDGVKQLCFPSDSGVAQSEPISTLRYPAEDDAAFGLTDGIGQQAFVLYASREPLPLYTTWGSELVKVSWPDPEIAGNWLYRDGELESIKPSSLSETRGAERKTKTPTPFKQFCDRLREAGKSDVGGVLFEVEPNL